MDELWLQGVVRVVLLCVLFRGAAAAARVRSPYFPVKLLGWLLCALAAWFATAAGGAWVALWIPLAMGLVAAFLAQLLPSRYLLAAADLVFVLALFTLSSSPIGLAPALAAGLAYLALGVLSDIIARRLPAWFRAAAAIAPLLLVGLWYWHDAPFSGSLSRRLWSVDATFPLHLGMAVPNGGSRIVLVGGAVGWVLHPYGEPRGGAVLYHGANRDGSHQHASFPLQRALLNEGYLVVSLDTPGYGQSPQPDRGVPTSAWDPLPAIETAYDYLDAQLPPSRPRVAVGHSMGVNDALRLLDAGAEPDFSIWLGGRHHDLSATKAEDYWYKRYHQDRRLAWRMPRSKWNKIRARFHDSRIFLGRLTNDHGPILFVNFGVEWADMHANRDDMWKDIPGEKYRIELERSTHYLNAFSTRGLILADVRIVDWLGQPVRLLDEQSAL